MRIDTHQPPSDSPRKVRFVSTKRFHQVRQFGGPPGAGGTASCRRMASFGGRRGLAVEPGEAILLGSKKHGHPSV